MGKLEEIIKAGKAHEEKGDILDVVEDIEETDFYKTEGIRNSISKLEIYNAAGGSIAIDYSMLPIIYSASADEIVIPTMINLKITITGNNLERLRKRLVDNRVKWIKPYFGTKPPVDGNDLFIEKIKIEQKSFDEAIEEFSGKTA